jgi:hypothetical protein
MVNFGRRLIDHNYSQPLVPVNPATRLPTCLPNVIAAERRAERDRSSGPLGGDSTLRIVSKARKQR